MSSSPSKTATTRLLFTKNIRLNLNPKLLPQDFFPESISQYVKSRKNSSMQKELLLSRKLSQTDPSHEDCGQFEKKVKNLSLLKKRLIKIKDSSPQSSEHDSKKNISFKNRQISRKELRKSVNDDKEDCVLQRGQGSRPKGHSRKLMDYMQKMKDVINIDIKFEEDLLLPTYQKIQKQTFKQNPEDVQTDDSPKIKRFRPKSQLNTRQRLPNKEIMKTANSLKVRINQAEKPIRGSKSTQGRNTNDRYNKFVDIQLNQEGMLTFYGSPNKKTRDVYDSNKYSARSSLPRLQK